VLLAEIELASGQHSRREKYLDRYTRGVASINWAAQPLACVDREDVLINVELANADARREV
jgi:hypothetical protein